jgi:hypothetical protein
MHYLGWNLDNSLEVYPPLVITDPNENLETRIGYQVKSYKPISINLSFINQVTY